MRCRICDLHHKNTGKRRIWEEYCVCRICAYVLDIFSLNHNYLREYWN